MRLADTLSEHVRRDTRLAYSFAVLGLFQAVVSVIAVFISLFLGPRNLLGLVIMPLLIGSLLLIGLRKRRPAYRTRSWRLRRDLRDGSIARSDALRVVTEDLGDDRRRANRRWWGWRIAGLGQGAAVALTIGRGGAPFEIAVAAGAVWLAFTAAVIGLEVQLLASAVHTLSLLDPPPTGGTRS